MPDTAMIRKYTSKQMGDACEMIVAAELTLAGVPAMKMPDNWPGYDVIAQPKDERTPQRISVRSRTYKRGGDTFVGYDAKEEFDWLAIVLLPGDDLQARRVFVVPKDIADERARRPKSRLPDDMYWRQDRVAQLLREFENNFRLSLSGTS